MILLGAEYQSNRRVLTGENPVFARVIQVQMHLSRIGVRELAQLEIYDDKRPKSAMKKQ